MGTKSSYTDNVTGSGSEDTATLIFTELIRLREEYDEEQSADTTIHQSESSLVQNILITSVLMSR